jgi:hypothetical protein
MAGCRRHRKAFQTDREPLLCGWMAYTWADTTFGQQVVDTMGPSSQPWGEEDSSDQRCDRNDCGCDGNNTACPPADTTVLANSPRCLLEQPFFLGMSPAELDGMLVVHCWTERGALSH